MGWQLRADTRPVTREDRYWQEQAERSGRDSLPTLRSLAGRWAATIGGLTGVLGLAAFVSGPRAVDQLRSDWRVAAGICVLLTVVSAGWATWSAARAAQGSPVRTWNTYARFREASEREEALARRLLGRSRWLTLLALVALTAGIGISWYAPKDPGEYLVIVWSDRTHCLKLDAAQSVAVDIRGAISVTVRRSCPRP